MTSKLKVGLIVDGPIVSKQVDELVQLSLNSDHYDISCIVNQEIKKQPRQTLSAILRDSRKLVFVSKFVFSLLTFVESMAVKQKPAFSDFFKTFDLRSYDIETVTVNPCVLPGNLVFTYTEEDLSKVENQNLDLLIRCGSGSYQGGILGICPKGMVAVHYSDNETNRDGPDGFWEVLNKEKRTGFSVKLLKNEPSAADIIVQGYIATEFLYSLNLAVLYTKSTTFLHKAIESIARGNLKTKTVMEKSFLYSRCRAPSIIQQLRYVISALKTIGAMVYQKLSSNSQRWGVAYQYVSNWDEVNLQCSSKIQNPPNRYLADPFVWKKNGKHYCFVEDYFYAKKRGCISVFEITMEGYKEIGIALEEPFHLSYPFLLEMDGELYMCPETHKSKDIRLYKCVEFPLKWTLEKILLNDVSAADTNIFYRDEKWWLLTNLCSSGIDDHNSELHVFYSDSLISDNWQAHPENPVIFDSLTSRNGGLMFNEGDVYRVFQRQGWNMYGEAFGVSRITHLSETSYTEDIQFVVEPDFFEGIIGTHTCNFKDGVLAIDFVEVENHTK